MNQEIYTNSPHPTDKAVVSLSLVESWVEHLLIHNERDALYDGFVGLLAKIFKPESICSFTNNEQSLEAHRQNNLADIIVFDSRSEQKKQTVLSELPAVYRTVIAKIPRFEIDEKEKQQTLYIPFLSGDTVTDILVLNNINLTEEGRSIWPSLYKSYQYLNTTLYLAEIDPLTGLKNRLKFEKLVTKALLEVAAQSDTGKRAYFAVIDIDFFKRINDSFGHLYGDEVLVLLARYMMYSFRSTDWLFRYGGEEFVVILRNETNEGALNALERFRQFIEQTAFPQMEKGQVTVSIGYSEVREVDAVTSLIDRADHALYFVKNNGRNKVASYEALIEAGLLQNNLQQADVELF